MVTTMMITMMIAFSLKSTSTHIQGNSWDEAPNFSGIKIQHLDQRVGGRWAAVRGEG
jgi:hypothetical protein